jgi:hypothetical protein
MTESRRGRSMADTYGRRLTILTALGVGVLLCACSSPSATGVLKGTATPCVRPSTYTSSHAWEIKVTLRQGPTVISTRRVLDTQATGDPVTDQIFSFTEPAGTYSISGPTPKQQPVVITAGTTSTVALTAGCK